MENSTVTIPLHQYEEMKEKIEILEKQVEEKTVIKYQLHPLMVIAMAAAFLFQAYIFTQI